MILDRQSHAGKRRQCHRICEDAIYHVLPKAGSIQKTRYTLRHTDFYILTLPRNNPFAPMTCLKI